MSTQRYEYMKSKYWEITVRGNTTEISYGAIGANPRPYNKEHKSKEAAEKFARMKINEKIKRGYKLVNQKRKTEDSNTDPPTKRAKTATPTSSSCLSNLNPDGAAAPGQSAAVRRFEYGATKCWEIELSGKKTLISYGPMGQTGRTSNSNHKDVATAEKFAAKKIQEKLKKGYTEVIGKAPFQALSNDGAATTTSIKTGLLEDGEDHQVEGSGMNPHIISRRGDVYSCSCPAWRFQRVNIAIRTCKHIRAVQGEKFENERTGGGDNNTKITTTGSMKSALPFSGGVMLANKYVEEKHGPALSTGEWWMSEKLDGLRAIWNGKTFLSRTGNKFYAPEEFVKDFPTDMVLDGELFCGRGEFDLASGLVRSIGGTYNGWNGKVSYEVFDAPLLKRPFEERMEELKRVTSGMKHASFVVQEPVRDAAHVARKLTSIEADDGEGLMLRKGRSAYEHKRSNILLKVKSTHDAEAKVIGHQAGKGKHTGKLGALICELPTGQKFKVGTGFTDKERSKPPAIGTTITFGYFELNKGGVPRFPTFKRVFQGEINDTAPSSEGAVARSHQVTNKVQEVSRDGDSDADGVEEYSGLQHAIALSKVDAAATGGVGDGNIDHRNVSQNEIDDGGYDGGVGENEDVSTANPTDALSSEDINTLTTLMGFTLIRAQKGLLNSNNGVNGAVEWLIAHQEDDDIDEPIVVVQTRRG